MAKCWDLAADNFCQASKLQETRLDSKHEAAQLLLEAGSCLKKSNATRAVECYKQAVIFLLVLFFFSFIVTSGKQTTPYTRFLFKK
jgi:hypothetical protein